MNEIHQAPNETNLRDLLSLCGADPEAREFLIAVRMPDNTVAVGAGGSHRDIYEMFIAISETLSAIYSADGETRQ